MRFIITGENQMTSFSFLEEVLLCFTDQNTSSKNVLEGFCASNLKISHLNVSKRGMCVDSLAETWALKNGIPTSFFPNDPRYGISSENIKIKNILSQSDILLFFTQKNKLCDSLLLHTAPSLLTNVYLILYECCDGKFFFRGISNVVTCNR